MNTDLSYREKNIINVLACTSVFQFWEIRGLYISTGKSWDNTIALMDHAVECGMSLRDVLIAQPLPQVVED